MSTLKDTLAQGITVEYELFGAKYKYESRGEVTVVEGIILDQLQIPEGDSLRTECETVTDPTAVAEFVKKLQCLCSLSAASVEKGQRIKYTFCDESVDYVVQNTQLQPVGSSIFSLIGLTPRETKLFIAASTGVDKVCKGDFAALSRLHVAILSLCEALQMTKDECRGYAVYDGAVSQSSHISYIKRKAMRGSFQSCADVARHKIAVQRHDIAYHRPDSNVSEGSYVLFHHKSKLMVYKVYSTRMYNMGGGSVNEIFTELGLKTGKRMEISELSYGYAPIKKRSFAAYRDNDYAAAGRLVAELQSLTDPGPVLDIDWEFRRGDVLHLAKSRSPLLSYIPLRGKHTRFSDALNPRGTGLNELAGDLANPMKELIQEYIKTYPDTEGIAISRGGVCYYISVNAFKK